MRRTFFLLLLLSACGSEPAATDNIVEVPEPSGPPAAQQVSDEAEPLGTAAGPVWESAASGQGTALRLTQPGGKLVMSIACLGRPARLVATVPGFSPIGSEDRFSLGLGSEPVTLVADSTQQKGPGVAGEGAAPDDFGSLLEKAEQVSAVYGAQQAGPHPAPPAALKQMLAKACRT